MHMQLSRAVESEGGTSPLTLAVTGVPVWHLNPLCKYFSANNTPAVVANEAPPVEVKQPRRVQLISLVPAASNPVVVTQKSDDQQWFTFFSLPSTSSSYYVSRLPIAIEFLFDMRRDRCAVFYSIIFYHGTSGVLYCVYRSRIKTIDMSTSSLAVKVRVFLPIWMRWDVVCTSEYGGEGDRSWPVKSKIAKEHNKCSRDRNFIFGYPSYL